MKWKWRISFFLCVILLCLAYCYDYQKTMYEIEARQLEEMLRENGQGVQQEKKD